MWMRPEQQFRTVSTSEKGVALHLRGPPIAAASRWCPIYPEFFVNLFVLLRAYLRRDQCRQHHP